MMSDNVALVSSRFQALGSPPERAKLTLIITRQSLNESDSITQGHLNGLETSAAIRHNLILSSLPQLSRIQDIIAMQIISFSHYVLKKQVHIATQDVPRIIALSNDFGLGSHSLSYEEIEGLDLILAKTFEKWVGPNKSDMLLLGLKYWTDLLAKMTPSECHQAVEQLNKVIEAALEDEQIRLTQEVEVIAESNIVGMALLNHCLENL